MAEAAVDLAFETGWTPEQILDLTIPQMALFQRVRLKRLDAKRKAYEQARKNAERQTGNVRTSLEAFTARQAQAAEEEDDG